MTDALRITRRELFLGFLEIGLSGFGGVLPWARRVLVERRRWLNDGEFIEVLSLGQALPGPNVMNASIVIGARFHGAAGSVIAITGLLIAPLLITLLLAVLYTHFNHIDAINRVLNGIAAAAAGLVLATGIKLAIALPRVWPVVVIVVLMFVGAGMLRFPLFPVMAVVVPLSLLYAWKWRS